jgi:hypothetical protein
MKLAHLFRQKAFRPAFIESETRATGHSFKSRLIQEQRKQN